jgi:hypothetical protein
MKTKNKICVGWHPWSGVFEAVGRVYIVCGRCQKAKVWNENFFQKA